MGGARLSTEALGRLQSTSATANKSDWSLMHRAGCRAQSFLFWASKVLSLGFCVGRVEEVEATPNADSRPEGTDGYRGLEGKLTDMRDKNMDAKEKKERKPKTKTKHRALVQVRRDSYVPSSGHSTCSIRLDNLYQLSVFWECFIVSLCIAMCLCRSTRREPLVCGVRPLMRGWRNLVHRQRLLLWPFARMSRHRGCWGHAV